jgi:hypothetical protein
MSVHGTKVAGRELRPDGPRRDPGVNPGRSRQQIETMRRERDALALRIAESQDTIERSKELLERLDQMLAAYGG